MTKQENDKYLILSATYGEGHNQVAKAISESIESLPNSEPIIIDVMKSIHPYSYPVSNFIYTKGVKKFPHVYSFLYRKTLVKSSFSVKLNSFFLMGMKTVLKMIEEIKPKVVISTYPFAAGIISKLKEKRLIDIPAVTIITDFTNHSFWIYPYTDLYVVGSADVRDGLISLGIESNKIIHTGIPIRKKFREFLPKRILANKYKVNPTIFTILIMGGGDGFYNKEFPSFRFLESISEPIQFLIVCGKNDRLKQQLEVDLKNTKHDVRIFGFSENIQELMALSDLMISKPGGVSISEAMAMNLPLLIYHYLPGQEEENMEFLYRSGYAFIAKSEEDLSELINQLIHDSAPLRRMKLRIEQNHATSTAQDALYMIIDAKKRGLTPMNTNKRALQKQLVWR